MDKTAGSTPAVMASDCLDHSLSQGVSTWAASVLAGTGGRFPKGIDRFLCVVIRKLYLAGLPRLGCLACVPRCRESCFADEFTRIANLLPRYDGRSNGHGSYRTLPTRSLACLFLPNSHAIHQAHAAYRLVELVKLEMDRGKLAPAHAVVCGFAKATAHRLVTLRTHQIPASTCLV